MSLRIQNNVEAMNAHRNLAMTSDKVAKSMERLSSGFRINRAADDAAGLAISERMRAQIGGLGQAQRNIQDGVSLVQTAEGNLDEVHSMLQRMRELAVQYKNGTLGDSDKAAIQTEVNQLASEIERIGTSAMFNGVTLLANASAITFQVGASDGETIAISTISLGAAMGNAYATLSADDAISAIDAAINKVSEARAGFGAVQNRLDHSLNATSVYQENMVAAESRIRDVDMAEEMVNLTKQQILQQAGTAMLGQAKSAPQSVLSLLQG
jgi:flagellin